MDILPLFMIVVGVLLIAVSLLNWDWYFSQRRAQRMINMVGRNCTRLFYALVGLALGVVGALMATGVID